MSETDKENEGIVENDFHVEVKGGKDGIFSNDVLTNASVEQTDEGKRCLSDADDDGEEKDKKEKKAAEVVGFFSLFRYASAFDGLLMFVAFICSMGNGIAQPASFIVFGQLIQKFIDFDKNTINDIAKEMRTFAIYYVIIAGGMFVCSFFQAAFWSLTAVRQTHKLRIKFFESILKQDIGWFDVNESGSLTTRLSDDLIKIQAGIGDKIGNLIQAMTMFFGGFGIGFFYSWELTLVILAVTPALMITGGITGKILASFSSKEQTAYASAGGVAEEVISSIKTVVAFNGENDEIVRFDDKLKLAEKAGVKKAMAIGGAMGLFHLVIFGCYALAFWHGSSMVADGKINGGELMIVFFCVMIGAAQFGQVAPVFEAINVARGAAYHVFKICAREPIINAMSDEGDSLDEVKGNISFEKISFNYPSRDEIRVLEDFNLDIEPGTTVALVGESGCGKSTVVKLLQRFYDVNHGQVLLDGRNIQELNLQWLRSNIGIVSQEPVLFDMSISENIRFGLNNEASQEDVERAAKDANAHDFIRSLPKGYDTNVGEGGAQLSGGQKQRIAIARALIRNPKILLFDEATSALDTESESIVQAALDKACKGRTTIVIAHRLSTVKNADVIVVISGGKVVEKGKHEELISAGGFYQQLVEMQTGKILDENDEGLEEAILVEELEDSGKHSRGMSEKESELIASMKRQLSRQDTKTDEKKDTEKEGEILEVIEPTPWFEMMKLNKPEWPYFIIGGIASAIVGAFPVAFAVIVSEFIKIFAEPPDKMKDKANFWALCFLGLGVINGVCLFGSSYFFGKAGEVLTRRVRKQTFTAILRQEMGFFDEPENTTGHLTARLATDASGISGATSSRLNVMTQVFVMGVSALVVAFYYSWKLTLVILGFVPFLALGGAAHMKVHGNFAEEESKRLVSASALATQAIMNVRTVATLGKEYFFIEEYKKMIEKPYRKSLSKSLIFGLTFGISSSIMMLANAACFSLGGKLVQEGDIEFQDMFKVVLATVFGALIAGQIASLAPDFMKAKLSAARIFKILNRESKIDSSSEDGTQLNNVDGYIEFENIKFAYPTRPQIEVLKSVSMNIKPGQKVALVGVSGCGKSTSVGLLERFYDPCDGAVRIDTVDISTFNLKWLRSQLGLVSQEPVLFCRSIRDNISYGLSCDVTEDDITNAAIKANIHSFVSSLPKGYDTMVGEKGTLISGGQKQRIAIARALIRDPKIMLLDEATSALDSESEKVVQEALDVAMQGRTSIIIAHRLSTIRNADVIIVLQDGQIVETGTHDELISKRGAYFILNQAQLS